MNKILISLSATKTLDTQSTNAFISAVLVMLSKLNGRDTAQFKEDMLQWSAASVPFLRHFALSKTATKIFNVYNLKGNIIEEMALELGKALQAKRLDFEQDLTLSRPQVKLLKDLDSQLRTQSVAAWNRIHKDVRVLGNPKLTAAFPLEDDDGNVVTKVSETNVKKIASSLLALVTKVTKQGRYFLTLNEAIALRASDPATAKEYSGLTKQINVLVKREVFNFVRASNKHMVDLAAVKSHLSGKGIPDNLPVGFTGGQIDDMGKFYTAEGRPLSAIPIGVVKMNPNYDPATDKTYVMKGVDHKRSYRTTTFIDGNKVSRFSLVQQFIANEATHRAAWIKDLDGGIKRKPILAAMAELIYATSSRIGGVGNATAGEPTYGMSTLQVRHLAITPTVISYDYTGKKLAQQGANYPVKDAVSKKVHAVVTGLLKGKSPTDNVFTYSGKPVLRAAVNLYLKSLGIELSIHSFRRIAGTKLATKIFKTAPFKTSDHPKQGDVDKWVLEAMKEVGVLLHHRSGENLTGKTALKAYIDPAVVLEFYASLGLRAPAFLK